MKTILTTLNAKYIHTSLALRWLYVANKDRFDISFHEFVIKEDTFLIANTLLSLNPDIIGIGIYIWNVEQSIALASILKARKPGIIVIAGGPEVSYEPELFLSKGCFDFIISGEGEFVLGELLAAIANAPSGNYSSINIESISHQHRINKTVAKADLRKLAGLPSPYRLPEDQEHRIQYFETSRGCPYTCSFCLSSIERGVRFFPLDYIFHNLNYLIENNTRQVKFTDRTFNLHPEHTRSIFEYLIAHYKPGISFQFEIYADLLTDELLSHLNEALSPHYFRFEIGIQSTCDKTNQAIRRIQNFELIANNIKKLMDGQKIDLHLDLIAGLPHESIERLKMSFDDVFALRPKELQLGFLKMLRGTVLRQNADRYGYRYNSKAPYEIISNNWLSSEDIRRICAVELTLNKYWNIGKFKRTMQAIFETTLYKNRYFDFFDGLGQFFSAYPIPDHYHTEDIFRHLHQFLLSKNIDLFAELRQDYYSCYTIRPHGFWENRIDKKIRKRLLYQIANDKPFLKTNRLDRKTIEKHATIDILDEHNYLLTIFCADGTRENPTFLQYDAIGPNDKYSQTIRDNSDQPKVS